MFFLDVFTDEYGVIEVTAHGVNKLTSKNAGLCSLFSYSKLCLSKSGARYTLNSGEPKYSFHGIASDIEAFSLASYFSELVKYTSSSEQSEKGYLRFLAISLYELEKRRAPLLLIKSAFELRTCCVLGFAPDLIGCRCCYKYKESVMFYDLNNGCIVCTDCIDGYRERHRGGDIIQIDDQVLHAMRYIVASDTDKIYKLASDEETINALSAITEKLCIP